MSGEIHHVRSSDGLRLFYRTHGSAKSAVLCLHGLSRNSLDFESLATQLSEEFRVISPDIRGRGRSQYDPEIARYNWGVYVRDVWTVLDDAGVESIHVIGTSLGGLLGLIMAWQKPERVLSLVLNDIGPEIPPVAIERISAYTGTLGPVESWPEAAELCRLTYGEQIPDKPDAFWLDYARKCFREQEGKIVQDMDPGVGEAIRHPSRKWRMIQKLGQWGLIQSFEGVPFDLWCVYESINNPILVIHGRLSDVLTDEIISRMCALKPQLSLVQISNRGHAPLLDEPEALEAIERFLGWAP